MTREPESSNLRVSADLAYVSRELGLAWKMQGRPLPTLCTRIAQISRSTSVTSMSGTASRYRSSSPAEARDFYAEVQIYCVKGGPRARSYVLQQNLGRILEKLVLAILDNILAPQIIFLPGTVTSN